MQQSSVDFNLPQIKYAIGDANVLNMMQEAPALELFDEKVETFLSFVSKTLLSSKEAKAYPDVVTLGFWMRKASIDNLKSRFFKPEVGILKVGRGIAFHIAPSNVPVNYAYSLVSGLLCGNKNIVRIPSKDFQQISIINSAFKEAIEEMPEMRPYICLVQYGHSSEINDAFSSVADVRIIWGGDNTIAELRKSALKPRAREIAFADRYSLAVIDSDTYMSLDNKESVARDFYNDTYLTDQNACTSPRFVVWMGSQVGEAKTIFWSELYKLVNQKYEISGVQSVNKLTSGYMAAVAFDNIKKVQTEDNLIIRVQVQSVESELMELKDTSGYFFEYDCKDILELKDICDDDKCQTLSYIGEKSMLEPLLKSGVSGIDRIVPVGKTMDFDLMWDGYNLVDSMSRVITIR